MCQGIVLILITVVLIESDCVADIPLLKDNAVLVGNVGVHNTAAAFQSLGQTEAVVHVNQQDVAVGAVQMVVAIFAQNSGMGFGNIHIVADHITLRNLELSGEFLVHIGLQFYYLDLIITGLLNGNGNSLSLGLNADVQGLAFGLTGDLDFIIVFVPNDIGLGACNFLTGPFQRSAILVVQEQIHQGGVIAQVSNGAALDSNGVNANLSRSQGDNGSVGIFFHSNSVFARFLDDGLGEDEGLLDSFQFLCVEQDLIGDGAACIGPVLIAAQINGIVSTCTNLIGVCALAGAGLLTTQILAGVPPSGGTADDVNGQNAVSFGGESVVNGFGIVTACQFNIGAFHRNQFFTGNAISHNIAGQDFAFNSDTSAAILRFPGNIQRSIRQRASIGFPHADSVSTGNFGVDFSSVGSLLTAAGVACGLHSKVGVKIHDIGAPVGGAVANSNCQGTLCSGTISILILGVRFCSSHESLSKGIRCCKCCHGEHGNDHTQREQHA